MAPNRLSRPRSRHPDAARRARAGNQKGQAGMLKSRWTALAMGLAFSVALAVVVGQRLSGEAMAVVIGVLAGVVASIPTSLIVVWFASRPQVRRATMDMPARPAPEPRIMLMPAPQSARPAQAAPAMAHLAAYGAQSYAGYAQGAAQTGP